MNRLMKHILIVEDEKNIAELLRYNLEADGYRVSTFGEGAAALEFLEQEPVDLVVLDLMLPGMSGYAVCEALRAQEQMMPIMILSARTLAEDRARGFEVGADQYLQKPFDLDEFLIRVKSLLAMYQRRIDTTKTMELTTENPAVKPKPLPAIYTFGNVQVDFEHLEVRRDAVVTRVTPLEMKLLRYFIEHEGTIVSRRELLERVWGVPGHLNTRAPDQFMRRLRKIIEDNPSEPQYLVTLRDAGYRFSVSE